MLVLYYSGAIVFWLGLSSLNANDLLMQKIDADDQEFMPNHVCTARCLQDEKLAASRLQRPPGRLVLDKCISNCGNSSGTHTPGLPPIRRIQENYFLKLICRDDSSLSFFVDLHLSNSRKSPVRSHSNNTHLRSPASPSASQAPDRETNRSTVFVIKMHLAKGAEEYFVYLSDENYFTIDQLSARTAYNVTVLAVHSTNEYSVIARQQQFSTLARGYTPGNVTDIKVSDFSVDDTNERPLTATITWRPSADMTCHYDIICFSPESEDYDLEPLEIRNPRQLYTYQLENLAFSSVYKVGIRAKNTKNMKESELYWHTFRAPSCVEWYNYNFNICAPSVPENLRVDQLFVGENEYSLNISWQLPNHYPDNYTLRVQDLSPLGKSLAINLTKEATTYFIPRVTLHGVTYMVSLTASTPGGKATATITDFTKTIVHLPERNQFVTWAAAVLAPIFCVAIISLTLFIICHRRAKLKRYEERCKYFESPIETKAHFDFPTKCLPPPASSEDGQQFQFDLEEKVLFNDAMEIDREKVLLYEVLGEGAFGLVRRGLYKDDQLGTREVAVKMLKDNPSADDIHAFRREIEVMKSVEKHPNIVGIIGHCTRRFNEMMLITEYCSLGNLLDFLRDEWRYVHELQQQVTCHSSAEPKSHSTKCCPNNNVTSARLQESEMGDNNNVSDYNNSVAHDHQSDKKKVCDRLSGEYTHLKTTKPSTPTKQDIGLSEAAVNGMDVDRTEMKQRAHSTTASTPTPLERRPKSTLPSPMQSLISPKVAINKSYGYDVCTNSCKCQVDVIIRKDDADVAAAGSGNGLEPPRPQWIEIRDCECRQHKQLLHGANSRRNKALDNKAYFGNVSEKRSEEYLQLIKTGPTIVKREPLSAADLLDIAKQVAVGMEFLAKNKVVHRDLAARNILVALDRTIKIADFGLSRDVYQENIYKKTGNGKLPIKWLALESMTHQVYTTQSDVWSYGILLYEIVTLGATPYPSISTNRLLDLLKTGYRMGRPKNCGQKYYDLMLSCWCAAPHERPTFTEIIKTLDGMINDAPQQQIESPVFGSRQSTPLEACNDEPYLKPLKWGLISHNAPAPN